MAHALATSPEYAYHCTPEDCTLDAVKRGTVAVLQFSKDVRAVILFKYALSLCY
jgi:hypothetical protein